MIGGCMGYLEAHNSKNDVVTVLVTQKQLRESVGAMQGLNCLITIVQRQCEPGSGALCS